METPVGLKFVNCYVPVFFLEEVPYQDEMF